MALPQRKFREIIFQILYSQDFVKNSKEEICAFFMQQLKTTKKNLFKAFEEAEKIFSKLPEIDRLIEKTAHAYAFHRISKVEKNILRLGVYELLFDSSTPPKVAISEAMRICKKFAVKEGGRFVNAILDELYSHEYSEKCPTEKL